MDCFGDFCLSCDRQTNGSSFCSQACRLAELDHSSTSSQSSSPSYSVTHAPEQRSLTDVKPGFYLPPAFDFSSYRVSASSPSNPRPLQHTNSLPTNDAQVSSTSTTRHSTLSPSTSQTSISSTRTNQSHHNRLSEQARNELKDYASCFDQVRTLRRRISLL